MKMRETNKVEICKTHGVVYLATITDHDKPPRVAKVECRCYQFDSSLEAKNENYECKIINCNNKALCIFSTHTEANTNKTKRPILVKLHKQGKKIYGCIHYKWNGEMPNE